MLEQRVLAGGQHQRLAVAKGAAGAGIELQRTDA